MLLRAALMIAGIAFSAAAAQPAAGVPNAALGWHVAREPGGGCWPPRCEAGQLPLATPVVSHAGRLYMIGDGAAATVYESTDGVNWIGSEHDARWGTRYGAAVASFGGALWRAAGFVENGPSRVAMNDVWRSVDGRRWERLLENAPWSPRSGARLVVFRDSLWLIGGDATDTRIWRTVDGRRWVSAAGAELPSANPQGVLVHRNALWILGHGAWDSATNDVWTSRDGARWTRVTPNAAWSARTAAGFAVLRDRLWIFGGAGHRDAWSSADGREWYPLGTEFPGPPRGANYSVAFNDAVWIFGGKTGGLGGTGFWEGVVYLK